MLVEMKNLVIRDENLKKFTDQVRGTKTNEDHSRTLVIQSLFPLKRRSEQQEP